MTNPIALTALSPREAIRDSLHRCLFGIDSNNRDLFESAYLRDESMIFLAGEVTLSGWTAISQWFDRVFNLNTSHITSNVRIEYKDGEGTAYLTANMLGHNIRPEDAFKLGDLSNTGSCLYTLDLVKDSNDGLWKIKKWDVKILWTTGDRSVLLE